MEIVFRNKSYNLFVDTKSDGSVDITLASKNETGRYSFELSAEEFDQLREVRNLSFKNKSQNYIEKLNEDKLILQDRIESLTAALIAKEETWKTRMKHIEWSDEDEQHFKSISDTTNACKVQFTHSHEAQLQFDSDIKWLESLKDKLSNL